MSGRLMMLIGRVRVGKGVLYEQSDSLWQRHMKPMTKPSVTKITSDVKHSITTILSSATTRAPSRATRERSLATELEFATGPLLNNHIGVSSEPPQSRYRLLAYQAVLLPESLPECGLMSGKIGRAHV